LAADSNNEMQQSGGLFARPWFAHRQANPSVGESLQSVGANARRRRGLDRI